MSELALRVWSAPSPAGVRGMLRALCELALQVTLPGVDHAAPIVADRAGLVSAARLTAPRPRALAAIWA